MISRENIGLILISLLLSAIKIADIRYGHNLIITFGLGLFFLIFNSYLIGKIIFHEEAGITKTFLGGLFLFSYLIIVGSAIYYLYKLTPAVINIIILSVPINIFILYQLLSLQKDQPIIKMTKKWEMKICCLIPEIIELIKKIKNNFLTTLKKIDTNLGWILAYAIFAGFSFIYLYRAGTTDAIISLWQTLDKKFIFTFFTATFLLLVINKTGKKTSINLLLLIIHSFLTISATFIIYRLGYGFDPFIHRATEKIIYTFGAVYPKTPYYIGQYSLVVVLATIFQISTDIIDKILAPVFFSLFIPTTIYFTGQKIFPNRMTASIVPILFLSIPFTYFIATTPFGLALLLTIMTIFISMLVVDKKFSGKFIYLLIFLGLASLLIHPLAGIPACLFVGLIITLLKIKNSLARFTKIFVSIMIIITIIAIPFVLTIQASKLNPRGQLFTKENLSGEKLSSLFNFWPLKLQPRFDLMLDWFYLYGYNFRWLIFFGAIIGLYLILRNKDKKNYAWLIYPIFFGIMVINFIIIRAFNLFDYLIDYERAEFPERILTLGFYFLLPPAIYAFDSFLSLLAEQKIRTKILFILVLCGMLTASFYLSYPRNDIYQIGHEYNVSDADFTAVKKIAQKTNDQYIVLANQMTSVAALTAFGFKNYYQTNKGELFFYPIPTSSPLYQYYLDMVYKVPNKKTMDEAMDLMGVKQSYLILNKYWFRAEKLIPPLSAIADNYENIEDKIFIFSFRR